VLNEIALLIAEHTQSDICSISDVLEIIKNEIEAREMRDQLQTTDIKDEKSIKSRQGTTSSFHTKGELSQSCCYCEGNHSTVDCTKEHNVSTKRKFKCCTNCNEKHHPTICMQEVK